MLAFCCIRVFINFFCDYFSYNFEKFLDTEFCFITGAIFFFFFSFSRGDKSTHLEGIFKLDIYFHLNIFSLSVSFVLTIISLSIYSCIKSFESNVTMCIFMIEYYLLTYFMFTYNFEFITTMFSFSLLVMLIFLLFPFYLLQSHFFLPKRFILKLL